MVSRVSDRNYVKILILIFYVVLLLRLNSGSITLCTVFCILILLSRRTILLNGNTLILLLYSLSFALISALQGSFSMASIADTVLPPFCFYLFGSMIVNQYSLSHNRLILFILFTCFFFGAKCYFETLRDILLTGNLISDERWLMINGVETTGTFVGTNICLGLVGLSAFFLNKKLSIRMGYMVVFVLSILSTIHMVNRAGIITSVICLVVVLFAYYRNTKHNSRIVWLSAALSLLILSISLLPAFHDVVNAYADREISGDNAILAGGGRTSIWLDVLVNIPLHPFGWTGSNAGYVYAHNMWLDVAKQVGWIPFIFIIIITYRSINSIRKLLHLHRTPLTCTLLGLNICMLFAAFIEPVIGGVFLGCYCMLWGIQERLLIHSTEQLK